MAAPEKKTTPFHTSLKKKRKSLMRFKQKLYNICILNDFDYVFTHKCSVLMKYFVAISVLLKRIAKFSLTIWKTIFFQVMHTHTHTQKLFFAYSLQSMCAVFLGSFSAANKINIIELNVNRDADDANENDPISIHR